MITENEHDQAVAASYVVRSLILNPPMAHEVPSAANAFHGLIPTFAYMWLSLRPLAKSGWAMIFDSIIKFVIPAVHISRPGENAGLEALRLQERIVRESARLSKKFGDPVIFKEEAKRFERIARAAIKERPSVSSQLQLPKPPQQNM